MHALQNAAMMLASLTRPILVQNAPELVTKDEAAFKDPLPPEVKKLGLLKARTDFKVGIFAKRLHRRASEAMKESQAERDQRRNVRLRSTIAQVGFD